MRTKHMQEMDTWALKPEPEPKWLWPATFWFAASMAFVTWLGVWWLVSWVLP